MYSKRFVNADFIMINILFKSALEKVFNLMYLSPFIYLTGYTYSYTGMKLS